MSGNLASLTDLLKCTLYFLDGVFLEELLPYVRQRMLRDLPPAELENLVRKCLEQHACFFQDREKRWCLDRRGLPENDPVYDLLASRGEPMSRWSLMREKNGKEGKLNDDGRFVRVGEEKWGLTSWLVDPSSYSLRHLVVKVLRQNPSGLPLSRLAALVGEYRPVHPSSIERLLRRHSYFYCRRGIWQYDPRAHLAWVEAVGHFTGALRRQKGRLEERIALWQHRCARLEAELKEIQATWKEAAATLSRQQEENALYQEKMKEKDLLLDLRKREIIHYRQELERSERKAQSILHQCRLWVKRAEEAEKALSLLEEELRQKEEELKQVRERLEETREYYGNEVAKLQREVIELKQRLAQQKSRAEEIEQYLAGENHRLEHEVRRLQADKEDLLREHRFLQWELNRLREENRRLERELRHPLVRFVRRLSFFFARG
ncbi:Chromosome segregation ATPase-like protein [Ammonifex degensii KC4]|uniref:Chromosome segregation ATPase-like protein n=1 Tax=Ammonifex degensii (strain DSM 10501 / KC4) TaxID=429009 RepID=C9RDC9_AMMDK|nr:chromosome segregation ATPase [Ammonifex degensii]ACX52256.1 Chromosome segregation ATPase-like protein [Ammonifex degensii KC4]